MPKASKGFPKVPSGLALPLSRFLQSVRDALNELQAFIRFFTSLSEKQRKQLITVLSQLGTQEKYTKTQEQRLNTVEEALPELANKNSVDANTQKIAELTEANNALVQVTNSNTQKISELEQQIQGILNDCCN